MAYDFTTHVDRSLEGSAKWNEMYKLKPEVAPEIVPFSVADMEFRQAPEIVAALQNHAATATFGYTQPTDDYYDAVLGWQFRRHSWTPSLSWLVLTPGVVSSLYYALLATTSVGDGVIIQPPVYYPFRTTVESNGRRVVENPLIYRHGRYVMDFDDLEVKAADPFTRVMILCSPHNPVGRVWTYEELRRVIDICTANNVFLISDEIHNDLIMPGQRHITLMKAMQPKEFNDCIVCTAPSKSFNLAGLQCSNIYMADKRVRLAYKNALRKHAQMALNSFAYVACTAAYEECEGWLAELIDVVWENYQLLTEHLRATNPWAKVAPLEGTYLAWLDLNACGRDANHIAKTMIQNDLFFDEGTMFGSEGAGFVRWNLACPRQVIEEALPRLDRALRSLALGS